MNMDLPKDQISKILSDENSSSSRKIMDDPKVVEEMRKQWNNAPTSADDTERDVIWSKIADRIRKNTEKYVPLKKYRFARVYGIVATFLVIISIGTIGALFLNKEKTGIQYVVHSGNQQIETIILADGTTVQLGAGSMLTYPEHFTEQQRIVSLEGQAFFEVTENKEKPFIVAMDNVSVSVLGTSFEIFNDRKNNNFETILLSGKVKVEYTNTETAKKQSYTLAPNQRIAMNLENGAYNIAMVNAESYSAWKDYKGLSFSNEKLSVIIPRLERWYGYKIECKNNTLLNQSFTFKVTNEPFDRIIELMSRTSSFSYSKENNDTYVIF